MPDLADVKPRSVELRESCRELGEKVGELRSIPREKRTDEQNTDLKAFATDLIATDALATAAENDERHAMNLGAWYGALAEAEAASKRKGNGPSGAFADLRDAQPQTWGEIVTADENFHQRITQNLPVEYEGSHDMRGVRIPTNREQRTLIDSSGSGVGAVQAGIWRPVGTPLPPVPRMLQMFVRDLITVQETGLAAVPYIRETTPATFETGASSVAEAAAKPEVTMEFTQDTALVQKLAAWVPATMEILQDAPTLRGYIDTRLTYMLQFREQAEILNGNGVSPDLKGILQFSGVQTTGGTSNDAPNDFGTAIGKIENVDGFADGVVMNPLDFWAMTTRRHSTFQDGKAVDTGENVGAPFGTPDTMIWGLPVVRTRALSSLTAIVGAWKQGATLFDRMQTTIRTADQHDTYFILNKVAILIEERVALAVFRPDFFVNTTLLAP